ncbi:multicopper oxidase domain-containing protein [Okeania sp. SIO2B3]|uniref:multicopper oxidase domain-containing protein n=1 Tax=Okeania sp. SIO2B3 TaxID=2607784 RepID=UPI0013C19732|nr:multicopper oxidase domain-containing protein [Okeania sp. SIO2B3]NET44480.1 multicopper oxidase domain-containing protein [Okeania sp. SIO2B3]
MFLVSTLTFVSTFTGEAIADDTQPFVDSCTLNTAKSVQPVFQNPPFAYADTIYTSPTSEEVKEYRTVTFDAVEDKFYLQGDGSPSADNGYDGYLYKTTYYGQSTNPPQQKTIVRDDSGGNLPGKLKVVDYDPDSPPNNMVGTFTPPTIVVSPSESNKIFSRPNSINLDLTNDLPVNVELAGNLPQTKENLESVSQYTNIHYHGFNVPPSLGIDDVLVDVPSNVTPKPVKFSQTPSPTPITIPVQDSLVKKAKLYTEGVTTDDNYKLIPVPPLGETTPDSSDGSASNLPGGYYPGSEAKPTKYGGPISEYTMDVKIPYVHQSGLFWYHSHAHSLSDNQVRGGLSGGIIIKGSDQYYEILSPNPTKGIHAYQNAPIIPPEPERFSVPQRVMTFKDFNNVLGSKNNKQNCFTLNGQVNPSISIEPGEVQFWRIANIGADTYMNIALEEADMNNPALARPNNKPNFYILARDGNFVEKVVPTNSVLLPPASRVEVLVVGGKTAQGNNTYNLVSDLTTGLTQGQKWVSSPQSSYLLATVNVENSDPVCYESPGNNKLNLNDWNGTSLCSGGSEGLYDYIEAQVPTTPTGGDGDPDVDKILPDPEELFNGYYPSGRIPICANRKQDFVNDSCLTPSTLYSDPLTKKRYFYFSQDNKKFFLKGFEKAQEASNTDPEIQELYDGNRIDKISQIGDLEEWHLVNVTGAAHVFHIHQLDFVGTEVTLNQNPCDSGSLDTCTYNNYKVGIYKGEGEDPEYNGCRQDGDNFICPLLPQGYRDVINLPPHSTTTVRIPFVNPFITGTFVYHCHILAHEDRGMMNNLSAENTKGYQEQEVIPLLIQRSRGQR